MNCVNFLEIGKMYLFLAPGWKSTMIYEDMQDGVIIGRSPFGNQKIYIDSHQITLVEEVITREDVR